ncbi:4-hydroxythreonine-4-phosphate dehydrogenase PdxA [Thiohalorhabdus methylotrophus]|uniref:4-hydroxythreonine-4-phosphate dehydrogenase n=1 Tax=Thiohalorhabdus methylotrophus TaxID=3242694 RepID=A0ABV4TYW3_9GAMM
MTSLPLAVTPGEPAGIGPDLVLQTAADAAWPGGLVAFADPEALARRARELGVMVTLHEWAPGAPLPSSGLPVYPVPLAQPAEAGRPDGANAAATLAALDRAVEAVLAGHCMGLVTGPLSKAVISDGTSRPFSGHTEYLAERAGATGHPVMMLIGGNLRVALVTTHLPLRAVPDAITGDKVIRVVRTTAEALIEDFAIPEPRILVTGLNPHAGEGGHLGHEEQQIIEPALERIRQELGDRAHVEGPVPGDTAFTPRCLREADTVICMYHDQGLAPLKQQAFGGAVNVSLGLPFVRTSVDHGTAFDLAASGNAGGGSFREAIALARTLAANRARATV